MTASAVAARVPIVRKALDLPNGARYYRCALQVNPYVYLLRHGKPTPYREESAYNDAIVHACIESGIEAIAVTDHYRIKHSLSLIIAAREAGVVVFPGFEAVTKDGIHFLCLMDPSTEPEVVQAKINDCGVHEEAELSPIGKYDAREFLEESRRWGAVSIAAHVAAEAGGLLCMLRGQARINAWKDPNLLACSLPGPATKAPLTLRNILLNKDHSHKREHLVAILNSQDVSDPSDLEAEGASCWIKMADVSIDGLRQAFLDPTSRVRLCSDPPPDDHVELVAMSWESAGFLRDCAIHFNENLNVLVGGRGTGKSTIIESLRYVLELDPVGDQARKTHDSIIKNVLKSGTKISLLVRSHRPNRREYLIERTVPGRAVVRDDIGEILSVSPRDILPHVDIFGQHEIAELTHSPEKLTRLLDRFTQTDPELEQRKQDAKTDLEHSREQILAEQRRIQQLEESLARLPALEETLRRYQEAGVEEKLKEQSLLVREEAVLKAAAERVSHARAAVKKLRSPLKIDRGFVSAPALDELPGKVILADLDTILAQLEEAVTVAEAALESALVDAERAMAQVRVRWGMRQQNVQNEYARILRELHQEKIDGEEFMRIRRQIEELRPLKDQAAQARAKHGELMAQRRDLLAAWQDLRNQEFARIAQAAKRVNKRPQNVIGVHVSPDGDREPLAILLRRIGGRLSESLDVLKQRSSLSPVDLVECCRAGGAQLSKKYGLPAAQAERISRADPELLMEIEEIDLPTTTRLELNVARRDQEPVWRPLESLSTGQKATAVLMLLLLESEAPLAADQPEDDLDNRFITDGIVPKVREEKRRRQFVFSTHNANIPVLGDAELIVGLSVAGDVGDGSVEMRTEHMGSIDSESIRDLVKTVLEGGREAFETRRRKYGF